MRFVWALLVLGCVGAAALGGYLIAQHRFYPYDVVRAYERKLIREYRTQVLGEDPTVQEFRTETILVALDGVRITVPVARDGAGGGMTSIGDTVLLMTHEGGFFAIRSPEDVVRVGIAPPENGFDDFVAATQSEKYGHLSHVPRDFRYNDVAFVEADGERALFLSYTDYDPTGECVANVVARLELPQDLSDIRGVEAGPDDWREVFRSTPCLPFKEQCRPMGLHMAGGRLAFSAPSTLYLSSGNYEREGICADVEVVQDPDTDYGKIIAIDVATGEAAHYSIGHRNPQGIALDATGDLWVAEHGARGGDELNRIVRDGNYGWPLETLGTSYDMSPFPSAISYGRHDLFMGPALAWLPSTGPSSLALIEGFHPAWDGDLLVGTLVDQKLYRIRVQDGQVLYAEPIPFGSRVRYIHQHTDGTILVWGDDHRLTFLRARELGPTQELIASHFDGAAYGEAEAARVKNALATCIECHSLEPGNNNGAPSLAAVFGADIASADYDGYSSGLASVGGEWTSDKLLAFIDEPAAFAPGTTMPDPGINDPLVADGIVDFLEALKGAPPN